ncbi:GIP [Symbiodinium natans]|uniref:GIP protein n=1 Tax=Symbiodinium natans TaxID=878477 RepID=A0A812M5Q7_9DINO|nr:GIP [Symbiodinium natans]
MTEEMTEAGSLVTQVGPVNLVQDAQVRKLAHAILMERKMRSRHVPVVIEALCTRQHANVLVKALAMAQQLTMMLSGDPDRMLSCVVRVTKLAGKEDTSEQAGARSERLLRVFAWPPYAITEPGP